MYRQLHKLDQQKHLEPMFSSSIKQLITFIIHNKDNLLDKNSKSLATSKAKEGSFISHTCSDDQFSELSVGILSKQFFKNDKSLT